MTFKKHKIYISNISRFRLIFMINRFGFIFKMTKSLVLVEKDRTIKR